MSARGIDESSSLMHALYTTYSDATRVPRWAPKKPGIRQREDSSMQIKRNGSQPSSRGPAEYFTGSVRVDLLFQSPGPAKVSGAGVTFEPGARSAWHTHPCGQTLIVTAGLGWTQCEGEPREEIRPGDVITCPLGRKHWHGATATTAVTHIAIQEADANGSVVEWLQQVTDEEYLGVAADAG
jgi:quercetin dioxygenase-like cupin family protein